VNEFNNANDALKFLEGKGIDTSAGRVFREQDIQEAIRRASELDLSPKPRTMTQAKRMVRQDPEIMAEFEKAKRPDLMGPSISANPDSSSRT
jgi:hypothetical protein